MLRDPIVALATPPGRSALAVIRLAGDEVFTVAARVIEGFVAEPVRTARLARFRDSDGVVLDTGLYLTFAGPHSYSGEDTVELTCHGGLLVPVQILAALEAAGARPATPGEFTRRAVLNGKLDLVQAEAIGDLIDATAPRQARAALEQLDGALSERISGLRARMVELLALLAYEVDFPEEDEAPLGRESLLAHLRAIEAEVEGLLATAPTGERLREGALVVLAGRPNAGKSSLFNALLGTDRALVAPVAGTTRDTIEAHTAFDGWPVRLADTAGLWDAPEEVDRMGVEVSRRWLATADIVLLCVDGEAPLGPEDRRILDERPSILVRTKVDLFPNAAPVEPGAHRVSSVTGAGIAALRDAVVGLLFPEGRQVVAADLTAPLTRERHRTALSSAGAELSLAAEQLGPGGEAVLAAHHVRHAALALDMLLGAIDVEELFDQVFRRFCVGK